MKQDHITGEKSSVANSTNSINNAEAFKERETKKSMRLASKFRESLRYEQMDFWLLLSIILLLGIGTMMVFSASTASAYRLTETSTAYTILTKQLGYVSLGLVVMFIFAKVNYKFWARFTIPFFAASMLLLVMVLLFGLVRNNARRWINLGIEFQPSEIFKIALIFFLAYVFSRPGLAYKAQRLMGIVIYLIPIGAAFVLIMLQPHMSCLVICGFVLIVMMFAGKVKMPTYIAIILLGAMLIGGFLLISHFFPDLIKSDKLSFEYIAERLAVFFNKEEGAGSGADDYQIKQSLYAIGSGGLFGRGFGQGIQKYLYLPEPYNDFIFSILAEELGFVGVSVVILLFALFIFRGYKIAANAPDRFGSLAAFGITSLIAIQVLMNLAVVSASMPVTGISLPLFSYGGTSLVIMLAAMGVLLNISKQSHYNKF
ncbi:MAG: cell division protein FtsW [Ruminococcaceae bacterium]|nr:cell division protein FtsW [Oscillospiraceae bacterium]